MLMAETDFEKKVVVPALFYGNAQQLAICINCLNNIDCVWMENKKMHCEEYN